MHLKHLGIIPDGNRRWANEHKIPLHDAYRQAMMRLHSILEFAFEQGVESISVYLLSVDNIKRSRSDLEAVLAAEFYLLDELVPPLQTYFDVEIVHVGDSSMLPMDCRNELKSLESYVPTNLMRRLYLLMAYDSLSEIDFLKLNQLRDKSIRKSLGVPVDLDLVIRTGGDQRLSGFLPIQTRYAELYFEPCYFPELNLQRLEEIFHEFSLRDRRFGK